jgi:archaellum component FlaG (FlaF/FlaG flagellin family)
MRPRLFISCAALVCLLVPASADARAAKQSTVLKVRSCEVGSSARQRSATFYARMRAVKGTDQMQMRFTLIDRAGDGPPDVIDSPALAQWRKSRRGVSRFGYAQSVAGLDSGGVYAMQVQFRWIDAAGHVIRSVKRTSDSCRQQGELPNLTITRIAARPGESSGTELYSVDVKNTGQGAARFVPVDLFVDGAGADGATVDVVKPGETVTVRFNGPVCKRAVRALADSGNSLRETNEDDNVLRSSCPVVGA